MRAQWVANVQKHPERVPSSLASRLKKLGFDFKLSEDKSWRAMFNQLVIFWKNNGHTYLPLTAEYDELSKWAQRQRHVRSALPQQQLALLNKLGFDWSLANRRQAHWEFMINELVAFKKEFGHVKMVRDHHNKPPSEWVNNVRARPHQLTPDRKRRLDALGFLWREDLKRMVEDKWEQRLGELRAFKETFGHCNVPISWRGNRKLAIWVSEQRLRQKRGALLPQRKRLLDKVGFSWSDDLIKQEQDNWNAMLSRLKEHKSKFGTLAKILLTFGKFFFEMLPVFKGFTAT